MTPVMQVDQFQQFVNPGLLHSLDVGDQLEVLYGIQIGIKIGCFQERPDMAPWVTAVAAVKPAECAGIGPEHPQDDPQRGRFATAVRTEQPVNHSGFYGQVELVNGPDLAVVFGQSFDREYGHVEDSYGFMLLNQKGK